MLTTFSRKCIRPEENALKKNQTTEESPQKLKT